MVLAGNATVGGRVEMPKKKTPKEKKPKTLYLEKPQSYVFYLKYIVRHLLAFHDVQ